MAVKTFEFTHIGQVDENQDRLKVLCTPTGERCLIVVADGLGGHSGGALAAQTVIETAAQCWSASRPGTDPVAFLSELVSQCHKAVNLAGKNHGLDPRSTLAALLVNGSQVNSVHVGDTRVMQFSRTSLSKRTLDHSVAQLGVLRGVLTEEQAATHPNQKILFMQIGGPDDPQAEIEKWNMAEGRRFAVCSDGFWELFAADEIVKLFEAADPVADITAAFSEKLSKLGQHDNSTVILAEVETKSLTGYWKAACILLVAGLAATLVLRGNQIELSSEPASEFEREIPIHESQTPEKLTLLARVSKDLRAPMLAKANAREALSSVESRLGARRSSEAPADLTLLAQGTERSQSDALSEKGKPSIEDREAADPSRGQDTLPEGESTGEHFEEGDGDGTPQDQGGLEYLDIDREIKLGETLLHVAAEELRRRGLIGTGDTLRPKGKPGQLGNSTKTRFQQEHKGVPVFGADLIVTSSGKQMVQIHGRPAPDIDVSTDPPNDYPTTVAVAERASGEKIVSLDEGSLIIIEVGKEEYRLGWAGLVVIASDRLRVVLDAKTGEILSRLPAVFH